LVSLYSCLLFRRRCLRLGDVMDSHELASEVELRFFRSITCWVEVKR
jgi:hypothetical protein